MTDTATAEPLRPEPAAAPAGWQPQIIALVCNWCSYAGADMAGTTRLDYPATVRCVRFPCTGRMNPLMILAAFNNGADGVLVSGCHPGDCHYVRGNLVARRRFILFRSLMDFLGLDQRRLHFAWVSASEGQKWAKVVRQVSAAVSEAGPLVVSDGAAEAPVRLPRPARDASAPAPAAARDGALVERMRRVACNLLESGEADVVLGRRTGARPSTLVPAAITSQAEVGRLDWGPWPTTNLASCLLPTVRRSRRVAMLARRCDVPAVEGLIREGQLAREDVLLVGVSCQGVVEAGREPARCATCSGEPHPSCEVAVSGEREARSPAGEDRRDAEIAAIEQLPAGSRWRFWQDQFRRCLRCYACRAACPLCYCASCIADKHRPQWVPVSIDEAGNTAWNAIRAFHLAGRCTGCDACARACPADIRLDLLNRKLALEVERCFGGGLSPGERAALTDFRLDDAEEFIL